MRGTEILLIRHGKTAANLERRYVGETDHPLCEQGVEELRVLAYPPVEMIVSSPLRRCLETAAILFPGIEPQVLEDLRETGFGEFEGMTHQEVIALPGHAEWGMTTASMVFPGGEPWEDFAGRSVAAFVQAAASFADAGRAAVICHGGTIMAVLEQLGPPVDDRHHWMCVCGGGYRIRWNGGRATVEGILP